MLASDGDDEVDERLHFSFATEIVELLIFTGDETFLKTLREAVGDARRLWHVPSADKVSDLLLAGQVGILVLDVQALAEDPTIFVTQLKRQFPDLVLVVAGQREAEPLLATLISSGLVYRFIHKPMSPARAKLFAEAAVRKYGQQRRRGQAPPPAGRRPLSGRKRLWAGGGAALALLAGAIVALWAANRRPGPEAPAMDSAPAATAAEAPLLARAEKALVEERLDEAATALEAAGQAGADGGRIAVLTAQLQKSRQRVATVPRSASAAAPVAGTGASASATATATASSSSSASSSGADGTSIGSGVGAADERLTQVLSLAEARLKEGRLIEPDGDNALFYVQQARRLDPDGNAAQAARQTLALALLTAVRTAVDHRDWARAASLVDAAGGIAAESNVENARQYLRTARERADAPALPDPMPPAPAPAPATATAPATAPTRQDEPVAAAQVAAAPLATARVAAAHVEPARAEPAAIVAAGQLTLLKSTRPVYPTDAATAGTEGWVELDFTVAPDGAVKDIAVHGANPRGVFENAAIRALAQWRYQPVLEDAQPVAQRARIRIRFALQN